MVIGILSKLDPESLWNMCSTNRDYMRVCKENRDIILKNILREYKVDYENKKSLLYLDRVRVKGVYQYRYVDMEDYRRGDGSYKLGEIFLRYKRLWYNETGELNVGGLGLSNIPKMPRLRRLVCDDNDLRELPDFESLEYLDCRVNVIEKLGGMPMLRELYMDKNPIREVGGLGRLETLEGGNLEKLERIWGMESLEFMKVHVISKIRMEDIRCNYCMIVVIVDNMRSMEEYMPETINVYTRKLGVLQVVRQGRDDGGGEVD